MQILFKYEKKLLSPSVKKDLQRKTTNRPMTYDRVTKANWQRLLGIIGGTWTKRDTIASLQTSIEVIGGHVPPVTDLGQLWLWSLGTSNERAIPNEWQVWIENALGLVHPRRKRLHTGTITRTN